MYFTKNKAREVQSKFYNYSLEIKEDLLNQIISKGSNSRQYFEKRFDELFNKYLDTIHTLNYNEVCSKFVHDIYELIPVNDTV